jgi:hypothetical protein
MHRSNEVRIRKACDMAGTMEMIILSAPERDDLFAEIYADDRLWAFVEPSDAGLVVKIVSTEVQPIWTFKLDDVLEVLQRAKIACKSWRRSDHCRWVANYGDYDLPQAKAID